MWLKINSFDLEIKCHCFLNLHVNGSHDVQFKSKLSFRVQSFNDSVRLNDSSLNLLLFKSFSSIRKWVEKWPWEFIVQKEWKHFKLSISKGLKGLWMINWFCLNTCVSLSWIHYNYFWHFDFKGNCKKWFWEQFSICLLKHLLVWCFQTL